MKPTDEQIKEFWEWCGFGDTFEGDTGAYYWTAPNNGGYGVDLPPIDLNNLFKYAVPKFYDIQLRRMTEEIWAAEASQYENELSCEARDEDPALALFWAIYEVIK